MAEPSRFDKYVAELSHGPASFPSSEESRHIAEDIIRISMGLVAALSKKWRMFKDAKLIRAGSMQDELKIGAPDEYDFMIELPAVNESVMKFESTDEDEVENATLFIQDYDFFSDVWKIVDQDLDISLDGVTPDSDNYKFLKEQQETEKAVIMLHAMQKVVHSFIRRQLKAMNRSGWSPHSGHLISTANFGQGAMTPYLIWSGTEFKELTVSIDYTLAVPRQNLDKTNVHYILKSHGSSRLSCALLEQSLLNKYTIDSTEKIVIRVVKYILGNFLPKYYDAGIQDMHATVTSYAIKNVVFHQIAEQPKSYWTKDHLGNLAMNVIESVYKHAKERYLPCWHMPDYNLFGCFAEIEETREFLGEDIDQYTMSDEHTNLERTLEALQRLENLIKMAISGEESALEEIKETMEQNRKTINAETMQAHLKEHVYYLINRYTIDGYEEDDLAEIHEFINANSLTMFTLSGQGESLRLQVDGSDVDLDEIFQERYPWQYEDTADTSSEGQTDDEASGHAEGGS